MKKDTPTVFVGMSGGVDSSVSAALLKKQGYTVVGVFMKTWSPEWMPCLWPDERRDAMRVAALLDIPFLTFDFEKEYKQGVIDVMLAEYALGRTPNPDVLCNREVKFKAFLLRARSMGADFVATGHYARRIEEKDGTFTLRAGEDQAKDQSYFLWTLGQEELARTFFPVGDLEKSKVRNIAAKLNLPVADKKDSQGLCFVGPLDVKDFLKRYLPVKSGNVLSESGEVIGTHEGEVLYTIGERHGFVVTKKTPDDLPYYVVAKNHDRNEIVVAHEDVLPREDGIRLTKITSPHWVLGAAPLVSKKYRARIRYRQPLQECAIKFVGDILHVEFDEPQRAITSGQSLVLYEGDTLIGGGVIV